MTEKGISFNQGITIAVGMLVSVFIWGKSVDSRLVAHDILIQNNADLIRSIDTKTQTNNAALTIKIDQMNNKLTDILIELQNKKNR